MPGPHFNELTVGQTFRHALTRMMTEADNAGIVTFIHRAYNQRGDLVAQHRRSGLQLKQPSAAEPQKEIR
jgi:acyl dehydratase